MANLEREVAILREVIYGIISRLDDLAGNVDALVEAATESRRLLQVVIDRGQP